MDPQQGSIKITEAISSVVIISRAIHNTIWILGVFRSSKGMAYFMGDGMHRYPGLGVWICAGAGGWIIFATLLGTEIFAGI
jgi:hypothetical protein